MDSFEDQRSREATESARARARELDIDLADVEGSGSGGRVTRDDVEAHAEWLKQQTTPGDGEPAAPGETHPNDQAHEPVVPGASAPPPVEVEPAATADSCVRFHCPTNPNFNLQSHKLGGAIRFTEGCYETGDPAEIAALRACQFVEEVSG